MIDVHVIWLPKWDRFMNINEPRDHHAVAEATSGILASWILMRHQKLRDIPALSTTNRHIRLVYEY